MEENESDMAAVLAEHGRGTLSPAELEERIEQIWSRELGTDDGREAIASALKVRRQDIDNGPPPVGIQKPAAGFDPVSLVVVDKLAVTYVIAPVLVGLVKDELKERLSRLWKQVLLPALRERDQAAIDD
jgi:hypothetical protein